MASDPAGWWQFSTCDEEAATFNVGRLPYLLDRLAVERRPAYQDAVHEECKLIIRRAGELGIHVDAALVEAVRDY